MTKTTIFFLTAMVLGSGCDQNQDLGANPGADGASDQDAGAAGDGGAFSGKRIFVTSASYQGKELKTLGGGASGLEGGDKLCTTAATAAGLGGTWKAWLSDSTTDAISRIADVGPWYQLNGAKTFNNKANLTTTPLVNIEYNEKGELEGPGLGPLAWTGTDSHGMGAYSGVDAYCVDWTSGTSTFDSNNAAQANVASADWITVELAVCYDSFRLFCLEQ